MTVLRGSEKGGRYLLSFSLSSSRAADRFGPDRHLLQRQSHADGGGGGGGGAHATAGLPAFWSHRIDCVDPAVLAPLGVVLRRLWIGPWREEAGGAPMAAQYAIWRERAKGHGRGRGRRRTKARRPPPRHSIDCLPRHVAKNSAAPPTDDVEMGRGKCEMRKTLPGKRIP